MNKIVLTGGGTAGHVVPHFALLPYLYQNHVSVSYIGSVAGIEKKLVQEKNIPYYAVASGKLRRYFDVKNFTDPFRMIKGFFQAIGYLRAIRPDLVFSKGGFVAVPVTLAAFFLRIPVVIHESDITPGLANRVAAKFARQILTSFEESLRYLPAKKTIFTGAPVRESLLKGDKAKGFEYTGLNSNQPIILVMGGSQGSHRINQIVRQSLPQLLPSYQVLHICGQGKLDPELATMPGYVQYEYVAGPLKHLLAITNLVISRAGSNAINEFLALKLPNILIPLSLSASRGDQIQNARSFERQNYSLLIEEEELTTELLIDNVRSLDQQANRYIAAMQKSPTLNANQKIYQILSKLA